jgi:hypothetical protein
MIYRDEFYFEEHLSSPGLLPLDWVAQIERVVLSCARQSCLDGRSVTSREPDLGCALTVDVVDGNDIRRELPWLYQLYEGPLASIASLIHSQAVLPARDVRSAININALAGVGARYEWHVDSNPVTGILYVTDHPEGSGGELLFRVENREIVVRPTRGLFVAFDAREAPHCVMPLMTDGPRISIPMNYYLPGEQPRPSDLDAYLYGSGSVE